MTDTAVAGGERPGEPGTSAVKIRVIELLKEQGAGDIVVFGGGIIPDADIAELGHLGVAKIFTPGASTTEIVAWVNDTLARKR